MKWNSFLKNIGIYTLSNVLNAAIPFILLPVLTQHLSTTDYGIISNYNALINVLIPFIGLNLMAALQVVYVKNKNEIGSYISSGLFLNLLLTSFFTILLFLFKARLEKITGIPSSFIVLTAVYATYNNIVEVILSLWRMEDKAIHYGIFRIGRTILELSIALILILIYNFKFEGSILAISYAYGFGALLALIILIKRKIVTFQIKKAHIQHLFAYGAPLIPHVLGSVIIMYSDKLMLSAMIGVSTNGIYSVGFMVGQVIGMLQNSFNQAWVPWVYKTLKSENEHGKKQLVKYTYIHFIGIMLLVFLLWLTTPIIYHFIGKSFSSGMVLVLWISLGFAFNGMYKMVSVYFFYLEKTKQLAYVTILVALLNILLNYFWIPVFGFEGAAFATMTSMLVQFLVTWLWGTKFIKLPWLLKDN
jgi:O-antigen/teichoic acid export membrane protein